jgi:hypothetical protein
MPYIDREKQLACQRKHYQNHKQYYYDKNMRRQKELSDFVNLLKQKPCSDCGKNYPSYVMDFDHKDGEIKEHNIARMVLAQAFSKENILKEIKKCDLVCSNCHRERTYQKLLRGRLKVGRHSLKVKI